MGERRRAAQRAAAEFQEWLDQHPDELAKIKEGIAAAERGEGIPFRIIEEEIQRRLTKPSS